jgi:uncharacterized protein (UPF0548 family)
VFSLQKPNNASLAASLAAARKLPFNYPQTVATEGGLNTINPPPGYVRDHTRSQIGQGPSAFEAAKSAFRRWQQFDLGWVRIANPDAPIKVGEVVAMEARTFILWTRNFPRILYTIDEPHRFGFGYGTTTMHVERGEERFLLEFDPLSGAVSYDLLAASRPAHWMVWLGYPYARSRQHKFARESHQRMRQILADSVEFCIAT